MRQVIVYDFEVFAHDVLLGAKIINGTSSEIYQTWSLDDIKKLYDYNKESIWIGHNNYRYDDKILQGVVNDYNEEQLKILSNKIINEDKYIRKNIQLYSYDLMTNHMGSLKAIECAAGESIFTTEVDFNLDRKLTEEEKKLTESYNRADVTRTYKDLQLTLNEMLLRLDVISEFNLDMSALSVTGTQLAELVLHAKRIDGIENWVVKPILYDNLQVKNKEVIDFYMNEDFRKNKKLKTTLCGVEHTLGSGGIHGARKNFHTDWAYYFDVSGYYNLVMINYDLLPRSIPDEYKLQYKEMYKHQLELKKTNPEKRWTYKVILLSVFGAMMNKGCDFYDPYRGQLVTMVGQMFLVDLLEKLDGKVTLIQSNTDGIIAKPLPDVSNEEVVQIINEWETRTGFNLKLVKIFNIHQRDVNCYMYTDNKGSVNMLGEALKYYEAWENPLYENTFRSKEAIITNYAIVDYYIHNKLPEETVKAYARELRLFQYVTKKQSYDYCEYVITNTETNESEVIPINAINRAFASNSKTENAMIYKRKYNGKSSKIPNLPDNIFIYNEEILSDEAVDFIMPLIDYDYYVQRSYERIAEFKDFITIKHIC